MSTSTIDEAVKSTPTANRIARKVWREVSRPFRPKIRYIPPNDAESIAGFPPASIAAPSPPIEIAAKTVPETTKPYLTGAAAGFEGFHPQQATVEAGGIPLIQRTVRQSDKYPGPIIEIGTLLGITTSSIALAKAPRQKIITVDLYCWNPWGLSPEVHEALANQMLHYLVESGHVERISMDKNEFFQNYNGPAPSMVFLDAIHDYVETKKDIEWAKRIGAKIISGHDYCDAFPGVKQAVDEFGGPRQLEATVWVL